MKNWFSIFIILHGLIHASYLAPKPEDPNNPFSFDKGWFSSIVGGAAQPIGQVLVWLTILAFIAAALGLFGVPWFAGFWKSALVFGSIASLLVLTLFWHNWLVLGIVINIVLLYGVLQRNWFSA